MAEFIEREYIFNFLSEQLEKETGAFSKGFNKGINVARAAVNNKEITPNANVVELKYGTWEKAGVDITERIVCSQCKSDKGSYGRPPYCSQCGAIMDDFQNKKTKTNQRDIIKEYIKKLRETLIKGGIYPVFVKNAINRVAEEMGVDLCAD